MYNLLLDIIKDINKQSKYIRKEEKYKGMLKNFFYDAFVF